MTDLRHDEPTGAAGSPVGAPDGAAAREASAPFGLSGTDLAVLLIVVALMLGTVKYLYYPGWTLRFAAVVAAVPAGMLALWHLVRRRDVAAGAAAALIVTMIVSGLLSSAPKLSLLGPAGSDISVTLFAGSLLLWAYGRTLDQRSVMLLERAVIGCGVLSVAFGTLQVAFDVQGGAFNSFPGRASGFLQNPAYFGTVVVGALGWAACHSIAQPDARHRALVAVFAFGVGLSASRVALGVAIVAFVVAVVVARRIETLVVGALAAAGLGASWLLISVSGTASTTIGRIGAKGSDGRLQLWRYGVEAWADRPVFGWGLARHASAVQGRYSVVFTRDSAPDDIAQPWDDPHNIAVLLLVSVGLVGLLLALVFGVAALRASHRVPLAALAVMSAATWGAQPASVHSLPVTMLVLGAAASPLVADRVAGRSRGTWRFVAPAWVAVTMVAAIAPSMLFRQAIIGRDPEAAAAVAPWYAGGPAVADAVSALYGNHARDLPGGEDAMLDWARRAVDGDPQRPLWWTNLALRQMLVDDFDGARTSLDRALDLQPWNLGALEARYYLGILSGDVALRDEADRVLCQLVVDRCAGETSSAP